MSRRTIRSVGLGLLAISACWFAGQDVLAPPAGPALPARPPATQPASDEAGGLVTPAASARRPAIKRTVFAVPCENATGQEQFDPAAAALGDLTAIFLAQQEHIAVVERQRLAALTAEQAKSLLGLTGPQYAVKAGRLLKADTLLAGRLFMVEGRLTVSMQAIDIASERVAAAGQAACQPGDLAEAALAVARKLGEQLALPLPPIDASKLDKSPIASLHFAKALAHYQGGNMDEAIMQFMQTIDLDPDYTEAHYWMGLAHHRLGEDAHAIIEWRAFLKREPESKYVKGLGKLLAGAEERDRASTVQWLGPATTRPEGGGNGP